MWYVVKTNFGEEEAAERELRKMPSIRATYLPFRRTSLPTRDHISHSQFRPTISGILFINVRKADTALLKTNLNSAGFFVDDSGRQLVSKAHLLSFSTTPIPLDQRISMAHTSSAAVNLFRTLNEQKDAEQFLANVELVDSGEYNRLADRYDTVCILNGPYFRLQGIVRQTASKKHKDRRLYVSMGAWTVVVPDIRRYSYIVVREARNGKDTPTVNTWRFVDLLIGRLQASYFPDNAAEALRSIIGCMSKAKSVDATRGMLLRASLDAPDANLRTSLALQATFVDNADATVESCLQAVGHYFLASGQSADRGLQSLIPDAPLRPFLTPTAGPNFPSRAGFVLLRHHDFPEVILRLNLKKRFFDRRFKQPRGIRLRKDDFIYYAHIGLHPTGHTLEAFVNWSGFVSAYAMMEPAECEALLADMRKKGYVHTPKLLSSSSLFSSTPQLAGFRVSIPTDDPSHLLRQLADAQNAPLSLSLIRRFAPVVSLLSQTIPAAVELWQTPRLLEWRKLAQRYVLLHKETP